MLLGKILLLVAVVATILFAVDYLSQQVVIGPATVVDGDTIEIRSTRYRLFGADAFERRQTCEFNARQWPCGEYARASLTNFIAGATITCRPTGSTSYDRVVAKCFKGAKEDLARYQVAEGWALADERFSQDYVIDQATARAQLKGAWSSLFDPPWQFRAKSDVGEARAHGSRSGSAS